nr:pleckstrin homology domain-containing family B member 1 isoform X2 [Manis javanica]
MALVRGGWLWRQSSILRRWKRNWFALWLDGTLGYYRDETAQDEEDRVLIHFNVRDIKIGKECHDVQPPEGRSRDGLLTVNLREGSRLHLCAETQDDAIAWKTALLEANSTPAPAGAAVPPRSRRVCPKVRCVTHSWSPCQVERRIWFPLPVTGEEKKKSVPRVSLSGTMGELLANIRLSMKKSWEPCGISHQRSAR